MSFKIAGPDTGESELDEESKPFQTVQDTDRSADPFVISTKLHDLAFLDVLLIPRIQDQMRQNPELKDREDIVEMGSVTVVRTLRNFFGNSMAGHGFSGHLEEFDYNMVSKYPNEYELIRKAFQLRYAGKSNKEILEMLKEKTELV